MNAARQQLLRRQHRASSSSEADANVTIPVDPVDTPVVETSASTRVRVTRSAASSSATDATTATTRVRTTAAPTSAIQTSAAVAVSTPLIAVVSSSSSPAAGLSDAASTSKTSSSGKTAGIAVAVVLIALLLLGAAGFLFWRRRKRNANALFGVGAKREKEDDERSFIGKSQEKYGMNDLGYGAAAKEGAPTVWEDNSNLSYVHTPPGSGYGAEAGYHAPPPLPAAQQYDIHPADRSLDQSSFGASAQSHQMPPSFPVNGQFAPSSSHPYAQAFPQGVSAAPGSNFVQPPKATMMGAPSTRLSVQNPYGAAAAAAAVGAGPVAPPVLVSSPPAEEGEGPFADPEWEGKVFKVVRTYEPSQGDELVIMPGDRMQILVKYDDDWCLGYNLDRAQKLAAEEQPGANGLKCGVFPFNCVEEAAQGTETRPASQAGANLQRAPTLPPLDTGSRVSTTFASNSIFSAAPANQPGKETHLSSSSSINQDALISEFPTAPQHSQLQNLARSEGQVKRTSSLIAGKDADLFAQLGKALNGNEESPQLR